MHADDVDVDAVSVGIDTGEQSPVLLTRSHVHALEAVRGDALTAEGTNDLSLPPLNLLGAIGIPLVLLAVALQVIAALRGRRFGGDARRTPPAAGRLHSAAEERLRSASAPRHACPRGLTPAVRHPDRDREGQPRTEAGRASSSSNGPTTAVAVRLLQQLARPAPRPARR